MALAGGGKVNFVKYAQTVLHNKDLPARENILIWAIFHMAERQFFFLPVLPKGRITKGEMNDGHNPGTQIP